MSKYSIILLLCCITIIVVNASGLDDFSNNLASDLGPLLSLLGEAATIQYLSESTTFIDYFIFAMAPIGIISTVTAVIRLCGNSALRAFIGKAQEGESTVEAELCTSTSADVCELFDKGGITRVLGRPDIMEIIYIPEEVNTEPRFHLFTKYLEHHDSEISRWSEISKRKRDAVPDSVNSNSNPSEFAPKPNISLNVGIKRQPTMVLYTVAAVGFILQSGVIIFAGIGPWLLNWNAQKLSSEASQDYAPGIFIAGTVTLCFGIWSCAVLVGQATDERSFERGEDSSRIYWLQPGRQVVGDQTFHSFIYSDEEKPLKIWTSSTKVPQKNYFVTHVAEYFVTYVAVSLVILGYVAQFIGLRGLNAWISITQLAITLIMSILRGALRMQRLNKDDNLIQSPFENNKDSTEWNDWVAGHELDWLAVEASEKRVPKKKIPQNRMFGEWISRKDIQIEATSEGLSNEQTRTGGVSKENHQKSYTWHITGQYENATTGKDEASQSLLFRNRIRLSHLTGHYFINEMESKDHQRWEDDRVKVRRKAKDLGAAVSHAAATLLRDSTIKKTIELKVKVMVKNTTSPILAPEEVDPSQPEEAALAQSLETVSIKMMPPKGSDHVIWRTDSSQLEAALGLWYWSISSKKDKHDKSVSSLIAKRNKNMFKIISACYGSQTLDNSIKADMNLWQGSSHLKYDNFSLRINQRNKYSLADFWLPVGGQNGDVKKLRRVDENSISDANLQKSHKICGWNVVYGLLQEDGTFRENYIKIQGFWINSNEYSLLDICVQELYATLLHSMKSLKFREIKTTTMSIRETRSNLQIHDKIIKKLANVFQDNKLGTYSDAISCLMPLLRSQLHSYHDGLVSMLIQAATKYRIKAEWQRAERVLRWACEYNYEENAQENKSIALQELGELYRRSFESGDRGFGENGIKWMVSEFKNHEIPTRYNAILEKINKDNDIYQWPASKFSEAINKCKRVDALAHLCFTKPGDFNSDKLGKCLPLAARNGWSEVVTTLLEMNVKPDMQDEDGRTAVSYFAERGEERPLQQLIDKDADLDMADHAELTPLIYAIKKERTDMVKKLLNTARVDCNKRMTNGRSALWFAVERDNIKIITELLGNGDGINQEDDYRVSPLFLAAKKGHTKAVDHLIKQGAAVDREDTSQATPLIWAMWRGHAEIADLLKNALKKKEQTDFIRAQITEAERLLGSGQPIDGIRNHSDGFCSTWDIRPESTIRQTDQQQIKFDSPYSKAPRIMLGISSIKMEWHSSCRVQWEASSVTKEQLTLTRTGFNGSKCSNLTVKSSSVVWIELDSHEDDFQGMV